MLQRITYSLAAIFLAMPVVWAQQSSNAPFSEFEKQIQNERGGWSGNKERLSTFFDEERRRLGDRFETELLKWLGNDAERHYWVSSFVEAESYLHGNKPLPHLSLLIKEQGLALVRGKDDEESQRYVVGLGMTAAVLSSELGFSGLARSHKTEAEGLVIRRPELSMSVPALSEVDRQRYDEIESAVIRRLTTIVADSNPPPKAAITAGVLNGRAVTLIKPPYPPEAYHAGASGEVSVQIVIDETGKVIWVRAVSGHPLLRQAAEDAAWQTKFPITKLSGHPVKVTGRLIYKFVR